MVQRDAGFYDRRQEQRVLAMGTVRRVPVLDAARGAPRLGLGRLLELAFTF